MTRRVWLCASLFLLSSIPVTGQVIYGQAAVGYSTSARQIYGYTSAYLDYYAGIYYDPEAEGQLYWQYSDEVPLAYGYGYGYSSSQPAEVNLQSSAYRGSTTYETYGLYFVRAYYFYSSCSGFSSGCYADPYGFSTFSPTGADGGTYSAPAPFYNPYYYVTSHRYFVFLLDVAITTPADRACLAGETSSNGCRVYPPPPLRPTPPTFDFTVTLSKGSIRPNGTSLEPSDSQTLVTVQTNPSVANQAVNLSLSSEGINLGGHTGPHRGTRPLGKLVNPSGWTDSAGQFSTLYVSPVIAGGAVVKAQMPASSNGNGFKPSMVEIQVPGLVPLGPGANYELTGSRDEHPSGTNHWGTMAATESLVAIADEYEAQFYGTSPIPAADKLRYNDQSLPRGGKFDLSGNWSDSGSHREHRIGLNCDIRSTNVDPSRWADLNQIFIRRGSTRTLDETGSAQPHWHARFYYGANLPNSYPTFASTLVSSVWSILLGHDPASAEGQSWASSLEASRISGQSVLRSRSQEFVKALIRSAEYVSAAKSDEEYLIDLYRVFVGTVPGEDQAPAALEGEYQYWLGVLQAENAAGRDGRARLLGEFSTRQEFADQVSELQPDSSIPSALGTRIIWRPYDGTWYKLTEDGGIQATQWGQAGDQTVMGDYDGDSIQDLAVWRPFSGDWFVLPSSLPGSSISTQWGQSGDVPVPGDYDGDGKTDFAVWRPLDNRWYIKQSSNGAVIIREWGIYSDIPVPGDFDGDHKTDIAVWRPSSGSWFVVNSMNGSVKTMQWGGTLGGIQDIPVGGDYDGDGKTDFAVWRPSNGTWFIRYSSQGDAPQPPLQWGQSGDIPISRDYDGDGRTDTAVWRPGWNGTWFIIGSSSGIPLAAPQWGAPTDVPIGIPIGQQDRLQ